MIQTHPQFEPISTVAKSATVPNFSRTPGGNLAQDIADFVILDLRIALGSSGWFAGHLRCIPKNNGRQQYWVATKARMNGDGVEIQATGRYCDPAIAATSWSMSILNILRFHHQFKTQIITNT